MDKGNEVKRPTVCLRKREVHVAGASDALWGSGRSWNKGKPRKAA